MSIKAVFIDVDDTLLDFSECARASIERGFAEVGLDLSLYDHATYESINSGLWQALERGEITREELYARRFNLVFKALGISYDGEAFERIFRRNLAYSAEKVDGAEDILAYLSSRYEVYVTSNAPYYQQTTRLSEAGLLHYIKEVFTSEELGANKPDPAFFDECFLRAPHLKREDVILIGDSLSADIRGGSIYGIKTCWFDIKGIGLPPDFAGNYRVTSLSEIKKII